MIQLIGLTIFEIKQFFKDKMGLFWTFLFPFVLLAIMSSFYGSMNKKYQNIDRLIIEFCGSEESFIVVKNTVDKYYKDVFEIKRKDFFDLEYENYLIVSSQGCAAFVESESDTYHIGVDGYQVFSEYDDVRTELLLKEVLTKDSAIQSELNVHFVERPAHMNSMDSNSFLVSGIITMTLVSITLFGISLWIVQMRSNNVFTKYKLFPVDSYKLIIAFIFSRAIFMCTYIVAFMLVCLVVFSINVDLYKVPVLILFSIFGVVTFISIGVFLSGLFSSSAAASGVINIVYLLITFPSNLFMPDEFFPAELSDIMGFLPVKAFVEGYRTIAFSQDDVYGLDKSLVVLGMWLMLSFILAIKTFRWGASE